MLRFFKAKTSQMMIILQIRAAWIEPVIINWICLDQPGRVLNMIWSHFCHEYYVNCCYECDLVWRD